MTYEYYKILIREYINLGRSREKLMGEVGFPAEIELDADGFFKAQSIIAAVADVNIKGLIDLSGLNGKEFAKKFMLPYRTLQDWSMGKHNPPEYIPILIGYVLISELGCENED